MARGQEMMNQTSPTNTARMPRFMILKFSTIVKMTRTPTTIRVAIKVPLDGWDSLDESEAYFRTLLESAPDAMIIVDHDGKGVAGLAVRLMFGDVAWIRDAESGERLSLPRDTEAGRAQGDGLPEGATGAALMCYAAGRDEAEAVRETVAVLKQADLSVLEVSGYGSLEERLEDGHDIPEEERALMQRALDENSVVVSQTTAFYD